MIYKQFEPDVTIKNMTKDEFILQKRMVDWLISHGISFEESMFIVDYCWITQKSIVTAYNEIKLQNKD